MVSDIPAGHGQIANIFLQCTICSQGLSPSIYGKNVILLLHQRKLNESFFYLRALGTSGTASVLDKCGGSNQRGILHPDLDPNRQEEGH